MTVNLKRFRATLLWAWAGEELVPGPAKAWWAADRARYAEVFDGLRAGRAAPPWPITFPWPGPRLQRFFAYSTSDPGQEPRHQRDLTGNTAFRHLVPLRAGGLLPGLKASTGGVVSLEAMLSPVGVALLLNLDLHGDRAPEQAADLLLEIGREPVFSTDAAASLRLRGLRDEARQALQQRFAMPPMAMPFGSDEPFALVTALSADGAEAVPAMGPDPALFRALHGMASGLRDWRTVALPSWSASVTAPSTRHAAGRACISAAQRGLLVWHPDAIAPGVASARTGGLNCYHRNLCFALLQAQCAMRFVRLCRGLRDGQGLSAQASDVLRRAVVLLTRLYGRSGYQTGAVRRWLSDDGDAVAVLDDERLRYGLAATTS